MLSIKEKKNNHYKEVVFYLLKIINMFKFSISLMVLVAVICAIDLSLRPYLFKIIIDQLSNCQLINNSYNIIYPVLYYFLLMVIISTVFRFYNYFIEIKMIPTLRKNITALQFSFLLKQDYLYYQNNLSGSLVNKINDLVNNVPTILQILIDRVFYQALSLLIAVYTLYHVKSEFGFAIISWVTIVTIAGIFFQRKIIYIANNWAASRTLITGNIVDALANILTIKLFVAQNFQKNTLDKMLYQSTHREKSLQKFYFWVWVFYGYSFILVQALCLYFLVKGWQQGNITIGDFALVLSINAAIVDLLWTLTKDFGELSKLFGLVAQALSLSIDKKQIKVSSPLQTLSVPQGKISFKNVTFGYEKESLIFNNLSVEVLPGQKVGLVGCSGCGKTTFMNLLLNLFKVNAGKIYIDDQDVNEVTQESLHQSITMISQNPSLFYTTILDNIRYGRLDASLEEVIEAARKAYAHDFIISLKDGYQTVVGEQGIKLSGGQKQRISISRAFLKKAPILIFDEPTSQLDAITERNIQESLKDLIKNKTCIIIAHRLATLRSMDRILLFDKGKIIEDGTPTELLSQQRYKALWEAQMKE